MSVVSVLSTYFESLSNFELLPRSNNVVVCAALLKALDPPLLKRKD